MTSEDAARAARELLERLTKPPGSLGRLEELGVQLTAIYGECPPPVPDRATVAVFAGDHGVLAEGVTPWPQEVTAQMLANFCEGGAAINVLARQAGAEVVVVDVGVASPLPDHPNLLQRNVRRGSGNIAVEPAMTADEAARAFAIGAEVAQTCDAQVLITGDMGIGNTTPSSCLIAALTGQPAALVTGRGTGIDDAMMAHKTAVVAGAVARLTSDASPVTDPVDVLAEVGGLEHAGIVGLILGCAAARLPVVLDGVIAGSAALVAQRLAPDAISYCFAGHRSVEPGHAAALERLGLRPLVDLDLRLGEGTGAALAFPLIRASAAILGQMATFESAGITA